MYEDSSKSTPRPAPRTTSAVDAAVWRTDPNFAHESFTMLRMQPWQILALAIAAAVVVLVGLAVSYV